MVDNGITTDIWIYNSIGKGVFLYSYITTTLNCIHCSIYHITSVMQYYIPSYILNDSIFLILFYCYLLTAFSLDHNCTKYSTKCCFAIFLMNYLRYELDMCSDHLSSSIVSEGRVNIHVHIYITL